MLHQIVAPSSRQIHWSLAHSHPHYCEVNKKRCNHLRGREEMACQGIYGYSCRCCCDKIYSPLSIYHPAPPFCNIVTRLLVKEYTTLRFKCQFSCTVTRTVYWLPQISKYVVVMRCCLAWSFATSLWSRVPIRKKINQCYCGGFETFCYRAPKIYPNFRARAKKQPVPWQVGTG